MWKYNATYVIFRSQLRKRKKKMEALLSEELIV